MAKLLSLKLDESIFNETERILKRIKMPRNRYINAAIHSFNQQNERKILKEKLHFESQKTAKHSMEILSEFEMLNED